MVPVAERVLGDVDCCITNLKVHRFHPALSKKVLLGVAVSVLKKKKSTPKHIDASDLGATVLTAG